MKWKLRSWIPLLILVLGLAAVTARAGDVDPKAMELMKKVTKNIADLKMFEFGVYDTFDDVNEFGQKIQIAHNRSYQVKRPDKLRVTSRGDKLNIDAYFDGKTFTWYDLDNQVYAQAEVPGNIDNLLDTIHDTYGIDTPMADLLYSDLWGPFLKNALEGRYLGEHLALKEKCHHLAFRGKNVDWQIWLQPGEAPRLRKFVITYKRIAGAPQYTAYITGGNALEDIPDKEFQFTPPEGVEKVEFVVEK
jgi:hypothetical protein